MPLLIEDWDDTLYTEADDDDYDYIVQNNLDNAIRALEDSFNEPLDPME